MPKQLFRRRLLTSFAIFIALTLGALSVMGGEPIIWETNSRTELLRGESRGVSVTDTGVLMLAPLFTQLFSTDQPYVWSSAADDAGNIYLGTGHDGRLYRVGRDGRGALLYDATELDVTALAGGRGGAGYRGPRPAGDGYKGGGEGK